MYTEQFDWATLIKIFFRIKNVVYKLQTYIFALNRKQ